MKKQLLFIANHLLLYTIYDKFRGYMKDVMRF